MNEYLRTFQDITQSSEQLLTEEWNSPEIQQSATSLKKSIQPCIEELEQSATRLRQLVQGCVDDLDHAEDIWNSKPRITKAAKQEIWEQLGEISGRSIRIHNLANLCKREAVKRANKAWDERIENLRKKWFVDSKGKPKKGIGFSDKEGFIKQISPNVDSQYQEIVRIISTGLSLIYKEITSIQLETIQHCFNLLDKQAQAHYAKEIDLIFSEIETKFTKHKEHLPSYLISFISAVNPDLEALVKNGWNEIYWKDVIKFKEKVYSKIEKFITAIFDDRLQLATEALEQAIAFYNYFLERQERYQQETAEQREAEKAWIDQQRQQLEQVQNGIEAILSADAD
jgi:hypothetical protein